MDNVIIYFLGFPGVGKYTIAKKVSDLNKDFLLIDNHKTNNLLFPLINLDQPIPDEFWDIVIKIRENVFEAIEKFYDPKKSLIFTNALYENDTIDRSVYNRIETLAKQRKSLFIPIRLNCTTEELKKRIGNPDRKELYKITSSAYIDNLIIGNKKVIITNHPNEINVDVTNLSVEESIKVVWEGIENLVIDKKQSS